jgi:hypothetical protein
MARLTCWKVSGLVIYFKRLSSFLFQILQSLMCCHFGQVGGFVLVLWDFFYTGAVKLRQGYCNWEVGGRG